MVCRPSASLKRIGTVCSTAIGSPRAAVCSARTSGKARDAFALSLFLWRRRLPPDSRRRARHVVARLARARLLEKFSRALWLRSHACDAQHLDARRIGGGGAGSRRAWWP